MGVKELLSRSIIPKSSEYRDHFVGKELCPNRDIKPLEPFFQPNHDKMSTIYRSDFINPNLDRFVFCSSIAEPSKQKESMNPSQISTPLIQTTTYQRNFLDYKNAMPPSSIMPSQISDIDRRLPFYCQSSNREYGNFDAKQVFPNIDGRKFKYNDKNLIAADMHIKVSPSTREFYQPFPNYEKNKAFLPKAEIIVEKLPSFKNQFKTSSKIHDGICPNLVSCPRFMANIRN